MMRETIAKVRNTLLFSVVLPVLFGCQGGGGSDLGSLFGSSSSSLVSLGSSGGGTSINVGDAIAQVHNPEPTTMVLLGTGLAVMGYFNSRKNLKK